MNKKECEIVRDLLPNYMESLTSKDSSEFIERHIKNCDECNEKLNNMKKEFEKEELEIKKRIAFAKKYNKKIKKLIIIIIILTLVILFGNFVRNLVIVKSLMSKAKENYCENYINSYHTTWSNYDNKHTTIMDVYAKDGKYIQEIIVFDFDRYKEYNEEPVSKTILYFDGVSKLYQYFVDEKTIISNDIKPDDGFYEPPLSPSSFTTITILDENWIELLKYCFKYKITSEMCNGEEAYRISDFYDAQGALYVNKETGITIRSENKKIDENSSDTFSDIIVEYEPILDEDVEMPNTEGYTIKDNV